MYVKYNNIDKKELQKNICQIFEALKHIGKLFKILQYQSVFMWYNIVCIAINLNEIRWNFHEDVNAISLERAI